MLSLPIRKLVHVGRCYPYLPVSLYIWDDVIPTYPYFGTHGTMSSLPIRKLVHVGRCYPYLPVSWYIWDDVIPTYP